MDELLEALKRKRGAKVIIIDDMDDDMEDESVENLEEVEEKKDAKISAKDMLGRDPFDSMKEKKSLEMNSDDMEEDGEDVELEGLDAEVADEQVMTRLKNGKTPKGIMERMQMNLMKKKS